jgi:heavy metal sensor kinase
MRLPIRVRLTAWYVLFLLVTLSALGAFLVLRLRSDLRSTIDHEVQMSAAAIRENYLDDGIAGFREISLATLRRSGSQAQILNPDGRVLVSYGGDAAGDPMIPLARVAAALRSAPRQEDVTLGDSGRRFRIATMPVTRGRQRQLLIAGESLQAPDEAVRKILVLLLIAGPIALAITALGGWFLVHNALTPVARMRAKAESIGIDNLDERLAVSNRSDEIGQLAHTLNAMLDRLEEGVAARRRLVADASHELRSPLTAMRAELDVAIREEQRSPSERAALRSVREDVDRMSRVTDNLLTLARADTGHLELLRGDIDLDDVVQAAVDPLLALAAAKGVGVTVTGDPAHVSADPHRMHQAVTNLVENAIKYTPSGGAVQVSTWQRDGEAGVTVSDNGIGIPAQARDHVFDRFFRVDRSRSRESGGSGLGLAICYEIAAAHRGRVWVESEEGAGSAFSIALPRVPGHGAPGPEPARLHRLSPASQRPGR